MSCGSQEPTRKSAQNPAVPTVSKDAALRRFSPITPGDVAGSVSDMSSVTTFPNSKMEKKIFPPEERRHKASTYVLELKDMKVVDCIRANCLSKLMVRMNDLLVLVPHIAIVASWPLSASFLLVGAREGVLAHSLSQKTDTCASC